MPLPFSRSGLSHINKGSCAGQFLRVFHHSTSSKFYLQARCSPQSMVTPLGTKQVNDMPLSVGNRCRPVTFEAVGILCHFPGSQRMWRLWSSHPVVSLEGVHRGSWILLLCEDSMGSLELWSREKPGFEVCLYFFPAM